MTNDLLYEIGSRLAQQCDCLGYDTIDIELLSKINDALGHEYIDLSRITKFEIPSYNYETHIHVSVTRKGWWSRLLRFRHGGISLEMSPDLSRVSFEIIEDISLSAENESHKKRLITESPWPIDKIKALAIAQRALCLDPATHHIGVQITSSHLKNY